MTNPTPRIPNKVLAHDVSMKQAKRVTGAVAHITLRTQAVLFDKVSTMFGSGTPDWAVVHMAWDETSERLSLDSMSKMIPSPDDPLRSIVAKMSYAQASLWQVLVCRVTFLWGWSDGRSQRYQAVAPPIPLPSTSAEAIWSGLFDHPCMADINKFKKALLSTVMESSPLLPIELHSSDDACGNDRFDAHYLQSSEHLVQRFKCMNHQSNLVLTLLYAVIGLDLMHGIFAASKFLRMGPYYFRCILAVRRFVVLFMDVLPGDPPPEDQSFAKEFQEYMLSAADTQSEDRSSQVDGKRRAHLKSQLAAFFAIFNGSFSRADGRLVHFCKGSACICLGSAAVRTRMACAALLYFLSSRPGVPAMSRWTRTGARGRPIPHRAFCRMPPRLPIPMLP